MTVTLIINTMQDCVIDGRQREIDMVRVKSSCEHLGRKEVPHMMEETNINFNNYKLFKIDFM